MSGSHSVDDLSAGDVMGGNFAQLYVSQEYFGSPPAANVEELANAVVELRAEEQLGDNPINISVFPIPPRRLFSVAQNLIIWQFMTSILDHLAEFIVLPNIQINIEYEVLTVRCSNEYALVIVILILSTWIRGPFSIVLSDFVPRQRYTALIPGLTEPDYTILSQLGRTNEGINASGWNLEFLRRIGNGMHVIFDVDYRSLLVLEARGFEINIRGQNVHLTLQE